MEIVIVDTEFTAWEGSQERQWSGDNEHKEIIQIAAIKLDLTKETISQETFQTYVKPIKNPNLSPYIKQLTGISQETIDSKGLYFKSALNDFLKFSNDLVICSWGFENVIFNENCKINNIDKTLFQKRYFCLNRYLNKNLENKVRFSSGKLATYFNLEDKIDLNTNEHCALYDVNSIAITLLHLIKNRLIEKSTLLKALQKHKLEEY